jgi:hypothetical protein
VGEIEYTGNPNSTFGARRRSYEPQVSTTKAGYGVPIGSVARVSLYRSKIEVDDFGSLMSLDLQKDSKKMYFIVWDSVKRTNKEMELYLK